MPGHLLRRASRAFSTRAAMKLAANLTTMFLEHPALPDRYKAAAAAGFHFVETAFPYSEDAESLGKLLDSLKLSQELINTPIGPDDKGLACVPGKENEFRAGVAEAIRYAKALHCPRIHVMSGLAPTGSLLVEAEQVYERNLRYAVKALGEEGLVALIEPINATTVPGYFLFSYDQALGYVQKIHEPNLKIMLDFFHVQQICGNVSKTFKALQPHIGHIQAAQVPCRGSLDSPGELDYAFIFRLLQEEGYPDVVGLEYVSKKDTAATLGWVEKFGLAL